MSELVPSAALRLRGREHGVASSLQDKFNRCEVDGMMLLELSDAVLRDSLGVRSVEDRWASAVRASPRVNHVRVR